jgi:hypothetical protein
MFYKAVYEDSRRLYGYNAQISTSNSTTESEEAEEQCEGVYGERRIKIQVQLTKTPSSPLSRPTGPRGGGTYASLPTIKMAIRAKGSHSEASVSKLGLSEFGPLSIHVWCQQHRQHLRHCMPRRAYSNASNIPRAKRVPAQYLLIRSWSVMA